MLAVDSVLDLVHDAVAQVARLYDPHDPTQLAVEFQTMLALCSDDIRAAMEEIIAEPRAHLERKLAIVLDGLTAQHAPTGQTMPTSPVQTATTRGCTSTANA